MISTKRSPIRRLVAGAAAATVALGLLGAAAPVLAADHDQDIWWYNNHQGWQGNSSWHDDSNSWRYRDGGNGYVSYRYAGGRPYYYAPPPIYYHTSPPADAYPPAYVGPASLTLGFTL